MPVSLRVLSALNLGGEPWRSSKGIVSATRRKNGWQLAEQAGESGPDGMQRLLNRYLILLER